MRDEKREVPLILSDKPPPGDHEVGVVRGSLTNGLPVRCSDAIPSLGSADYVCLKTNHSQGMKLDCLYILSGSFAIVLNVGLFLTNRWSHPRNFTG